jgi:hypothetical protein
MIDDRQFHSRGNDMNKLIFRVILSTGLAALCGSAMAAPSIMITTAPYGRGGLIVSVDFQADAAFPVAVAQIQVGLKDEMSNDRRIDLKQCNEVTKGSMWIGCSTKKGDFTVLVDASGGGTPIASGNLATITLPKAVLELDATGRLSVPFVELVSADGTKINAEVVADLVEAPLGRGRQSK